MTSLVCKVDEPELGLTTVTLDRDGFIIAFKDVPAQGCPNCGEPYVDSAITSRLFTQVQDVVTIGSDSFTSRLNAQSPTM